MARAFRLPPSKKQLERDLDDELALHLALRTDALVRGGMPEGAARVEALRLFGDQASVRDDCLTIDVEHRATQRRWNAVAELRQDVAIAWRTLRREAGFVALVILIFALGIGATTAIWTLYAGVVLRPLAVRDPGRVVWVTTVDDELGESVSPAAWFAWRDRARTLERIATTRTVASTLLGSGDPVRLEGLYVGEGLFQTLGVVPAAGRAFAARDYERGGEAVVMLGHALWMQRFGGDGDIIGRSVSLDGTLRTVVGVAPPSMDALGGASQFFIPEQLGEGLRRNWTGFLTAIGRLAPSVSPERATAELQTILTEALRGRENDVGARRARVIALGDHLTAPFRDRVLLLFVGVVCVLVIGCVNVANLLLARGSARGRELAVRASLGASRGRLVRQLLTENALLALVGGALGIGLGVWMVRALVTVLPRDLPRLAQVRLDGGSVVFAVVLTLATALVAGLLPALRAAAVDPRTMLQDGGRGATSGRTHDRLRRGFVVLEVALTAVLLVASGLLVRSASALGRVAPGFSPDSVLTARYSLPDREYAGAARVVATHERILTTVRERVGTNVALSSSIPLGDGGGGSDFYVVAGGAVSRRDVNAGLRFVTPRYLATMGIDLIAGRDFTEDDRRGSRRVVIVSELLARRLGIAGDAVGREIAGTSSPFKDSTGTPFPWEIVGVARDPRDAGLRRDPEPHVFMPLAQTPAEIFDWSARAVHVVARSPLPQSEVVARIAAGVQSVDPRLPIYDVQTMRGRLRASMALEETNTVLITALAIAALVLAVTGLYGVISYGVHQRLPEIGVRLALGAQGAQIVRMITQWGAGLTLVGLAIGLPAALVVAQGLRSLLYGVTAFDLVTVGGVALLLAVVSAASCIVPARRALNVDASDVLRG